MSYKEKFISHLIYEFYFLIDEGYDELSIDNHNIAFGVMFYAKNIKRWINIYQSELCDLRISFMNKYLIVSLLPLRYGPNRKSAVEANCYYKNNQSFNNIAVRITESNYKDILKSHADFLKANLMPIVKGKEWFK